MAEKNDSNVIFLDVGHNMSQVGGYNDIIDEIWWINNKVILL